MISPDCQYVVGIPGAALGLKLKKLLLPIHENVAGNEVAQGDPGFVSKSKKVKVAQEPVWFTQLNPVSADKATGSTATLARWDASPLQLHPTVHWRYPFTQLGHRRETMWSTISCLRKQQQYRDQPSLKTMTP